MTLRKVGIPIKLQTVMSLKSLVFAIVLIIGIGSIALSDGDMKSEMAITGTICLSTALVWFVFDHKHQQRFEGLYSRRNRLAILKHFAGVDEDAARAKMSALQWPNELISFVFDIQYQLQEEASDKIKLGLKLLFIGFFFTLAILSVTNSLGTSRYYVAAGALAVGISLIVDGALLHLRVALVLSCAKPKDLNSVLSVKIPGF